MRRCFFFISLLLLSFALRSQTVHNLSFQNIDDSTIVLSSFANKKILVIILPLSQNDSAYNQLLAFRQRYLDTVHIVGVLSYEDGYQASQATMIKNLYSPLGIMLTEGMYTKKASVGQSVIMKWLTDKTKNAHFNLDANGIGSKFFISKSGRLFAVLAPAGSLQSNIVGRVIQSTTQ